jgi:hypothetical protein
MKCDHFLKNEVGLKKDNSLTIQRWLTALAADGKVKTMPQHFTYGLLIR